MVNEMDKISYNIEEGLPELVDYSRKLLGLYKTFIFYVIESD